MDKTLLAHLTDAGTPLPSAAQHVIYDLACRSRNVAALAALAARPELEKDLVTALATDPHATVRAAWATVPPRVATNPDWFGTETRPVVLKAIAGLTGLPATTYITCASSPSTRVAEALVVNPDISETIRHTLVARLAKATTHSGPLEEALLTYPHLADTAIMAANTLEQVVWLAAIPGFTPGPKASIRIVEQFNNRLTAQADKITTAQVDTDPEAAAAVVVWDATMALAADLTATGVLPAYAAATLAAQVETLVADSYTALGTPYLPDVLSPAVYTAKTWSTGTILAKLHKIGSPGELAKFLDSTQVAQVTKITLIAKVRPYVTSTVACSAACTPEIVEQMLSSRAAAALSGRFLGWLRHAIRIHADAGRTETAAALAVFADLGHNPSSTASMLATAAGVSIDDLQHRVAALCVAAGRLDLLTAWSLTDSQLTSSIIDAVPLTAVAKAVGGQRLAAYLISRLGDSRDRWDEFFALATSSPHMAVGCAVDAAVRSVQLDEARRHGEA